MAKKKRNRIPPHPSAAVGPDFGWTDVWILLALVLVTLGVYAQVRTHQFISLDDDLYICDNPIVARGLTLSGIAWAFTTFHAANWHPLTWLSHMLDGQLFGLNAGAHLLVNALLHIANSCILFLFLRRATGMRWSSALVAALFALHPLHVESVAWAAERKDTLAACFGLLALAAYVRYTEKISWPRYTLVALFFALGLMAKPMLVTWPFVFLLLDFWPLRRLASRADFWPRLREKLPLFAVVVASMIVTFLAQARGGAVRALEDAPLALRVSNAIVSYAKYSFATLWPADLAVYYPFSAGGIPTWQVAGALLWLSALTALALRSARSRPWFIVGWLWFLGTLVPVIGLVQVGGQAWADRYHYLPSIGLFVALVFGFAELAAAQSRVRIPLAAASAVALLLCASLTAVQITRWRDSITLFTHTLSVTGDNLVIEYNLGHALGQQRRYDEALTHFANALRIKPDFFDALINTGMTLTDLGRAAEAINFLERALRIAPSSSKAHTQLALALVQQGRQEQALLEFRQALALAPQDADARVNLGLMLARQGNLAEATEQLEEAVRLNPDSAEAHNNLGLVLLAGGKTDESIPHFSTALRLKPELAVARDNLQRARMQLSAGKR